MRRRDWEKGCRDELSITPAPRKRGAGFSHQSRPRNRTGEALQARSEPAGRIRYDSTYLLYKTTKIIKPEDNNEKPNLAIQCAVRSVHPDPDASDSDDRLRGDLDGATGDGGDSGQCR